MKKYRMTFDSLESALSGFCNRRACAGCPFDKETTGESCADYCNADHECEMHSFFPKKPSRQEERK